jgi:predicted Ser/Thr protein kinase
MGAGSASQIAEEEAAFRRAEMETLGAAFPQFELIELLGRGGMGEVYEARQKKLGRLVAIKILPEPFGKSDEYTERFLREARSLALLNHPNIVTIYDFGDADGLCYFVMEYIDGVDLRRMIEARTLSPEEALRIVPQICDALQFAHDAGVVHRDIKPANILIDKLGRVKIADFGLAKIVRKEARDFTLTGAGEVMGTAEYMAPEQRRSSQTVDHRADIYSLGVVFYEMLTGEVPMGKFDPPSKRVSVDVRLDDVVLRTLEREPERRYQKASEVKTSIEAIHGSHPSDAAQPSTPAARPHRYPIPYILLSTGVFALAWTGALALWNFRTAIAVIGGVFLFIALYGLLALGRKWFPIIGLNWRKDSLGNHLVRCGIALVHCLLGYYLTLSATLAIHERLNWRFPYHDMEHFEEKTKGTEYKLMRQLNAYKTTVPSVEFSRMNFSWQRGIAGFGITQPNYGLYPGWGIYVLLGFGFLLLANAGNVLVSTRIWSWRLDSAWRLVRWPMAAMGTAFVAGWCVYEYAVLFASLSRSYPVQTEVRINLPLDEVRSRVEQIIKDEFYAIDATGKRRDGFVTGEKGEWRISTVPEGKGIGTVAFTNVWMESPFDRWYWRKGGLLSSTPQIQILYLSSNEPLETKVRFDLYWANTPPAPAESERLLAELAKAVTSETR